MKRCFIILLLLACNVAFSQKHTVDILIKNGRIIDGTGNSWFYGDVAIKDGKIVDIGNLSDYNAAKVIQADSQIIAPGFIDVHTHIEGDEFRQPTADNFILDGVTSVITGNCGTSKTNLKEYFSKIANVRLSVNTGSLVGHNSIRENVMGNDNRDPSPAEMRKMEALVRKAMQDGAMGLSTGLIYIPGTFAKKEEIVDLAKVVASYNGLYASHMRSESDSAVQAIEETIDIGRQAHLPVEISHFKIGGQHNWGRSRETLPLVIKAREEGLDVTIDQYPYTASSTSLGTMLPDWIMANGRDSVKARLKRVEVRKEAVAYMLEKLGKRGLEHYSYAAIANYNANTSLNGKTIEEANRILGREYNAASEAELILQMVENGGASMVFHGMSEDDVKYIMQYPFNMFASDASIRVYREGVPHPRGYGTNARVLAKYVREEKVLSLEEAIRRMTSLPAQRFQLTDRGLLRKGFAADIVVFDEKTVRDNSVYDKPHQYSTGFSYVLVNGKVTVDKGKHTGVKNGAILYGPGKAN